MEQKKEKKEKKEAKFNADKTSRLVEKSLESVFPKAKFFVRKGTPVEALATDANGYTAGEFEMFRNIFCVTSRTDPANISIAKANKETAEKPVTAAAPAK
jgi:hypothetical protein